MDPAELEARSRQAIEQTVTPLGVAMLLGIDAMHESSAGDERFNSALFFDREGRLQGQYAKTHIVPFGEYVPFAETFPWLYRLTPLPGGIHRGAGPVSVRVGKASYAPISAMKTRSRNSSAARLCNCGRKIASPTSL